MGRRCLSHKYWHKLQWAFPYSLHSFCCIMCLHHLRAHGLFSANTRGALIFEYNEHHTDHHVQSWFLPCGWWWWWLRSCHWCGTKEKGRVTDSAGAQWAGLCRRTKLGTRIGARSVTEELDVSCGLDHHQHRANWKQLSQSSTTIRFRLRLFCETPGYASVTWQKSFQRLLNLSNQRKPAKTSKLGHFETYVWFRGNLPWGSAMETWKLRKSGNYG